ncbi:lysylphosphatidylglycerol synthase transmembrane domain-containing protein [Streptomyces sp. Tue6028]|uniref:lysylphosphatidylglycerol synthase transmembrane domain-containing protein n=1 Tax=Streptomyces sp. Tue6028 TaxID=2036037 RepID=UPI003D7380FF
MSGSRQAEMEGQQESGGETGVLDGHACRTDEFIPPVRLRRRTVLTAGVMVIVLGTESVLVAPYARRAAGQLAHVRPMWLLLALGAEMASMMAFARLQRLALGTGGLRVALGSAVATVFGGNALGATLPGGSLVSITYRTRRMRSWGASVPQIGFTHAATGVLSTIALVVLAGAGKTLAGDGSQLARVAVHIGVICALTSAALILIHHAAVLRRPANALLRLWRRLRRGSAGKATADRLLDELAAMHPPARFWLRGFGFALLNWTADCLCLLAVCHAVGARPALGTVLLAYTAGVAAASAMPLLPAGIGALDAALVLALHHGGVASSTATAADLLYRTITPGLVAVAGWALLLRQRRRSARGQGPCDGACAVPTAPSTSPAASLAGWRR